MSVAGNTLRILTVERYGEIFNQQSTKLAYTPRKAALLKNANCFVVIETDHNSEVAESVIKAGMQVEGQEEEEEDDEMPEGVYGVHRAGEGKWASCIRVVEPVEKETMQLIPLDEDEAGLCVCTCTFPSRPGMSSVANLHMLFIMPLAHSSPPIESCHLQSPGETFVLVGSVTKMNLQKRDGTGCIRLYSVSSYANYHSGNTVNTGFLALLLPAIFTRFACPLHSRPHPASLSSHWDPTCLMIRSLSIPRLRFPATS